MNDITVYNQRMASSILDKLFFMSKIDENDIDTIVDFGCANAELFKTMPMSWSRHGKRVRCNFENPRENSWRKIGIDNNPKMLSLAKFNYPDGEYVKSFEDVHAGPNALLNISSTIHEIYSYCTLEEIDDFWHNVFHKNFKYISIRDMMVSEKTDRPMSDHEKSILKKYNDADYHRLYDDFRRYYAEVRVRDMLHFMQKYRYVENWDRECRENYFPITVEYLLSLIPQDIYEVVYLNTYCLKWVKDRIKEDFGYSVKDGTHVQLLLKRREK